MQVMMRDMDVRVFLENFSVSIAHEPQEWRDWYCLYVEINEAHQDTSIFDLAHAATRILQPRKGVVLRLDEKSLFFTFSANDDFSFVLFFDEMQRVAGLQATQLNISFLHPADNQKTIRELIERKCGMVDVAFVPAQDTADQQADEKKVAVASVTSMIKSWMEPHHAHIQNLCPYILVVDDDEFTRRLVSTALKKTYPVTVAADGIDALEKNMVQMPDIIFLDIDLPDLDGFKILDHVKRCSPETAVVMFSGNSNPHVQAYAQHKGAKAFLAKPFKREHFLDVIDDWKRGSGTAAHR